MPEVTIFRQAIDVGTDRERAFYALQPHADYNPVARLVGEFQIDERNEPAQIVVGNRKYRIGQLSPIRCLQLNMRLYSTGTPTTNYTHGYYIIRNIVEADHPVIEFSDDNFTSSDSPQDWQEEETTIPLSKSEKADFIERCHNLTDFAIIEVARSLSTTTDGQHRSYNVLLHDQLTMPLTMGG